ncbi:MAG: hypothetical protein EZS28_038238 [Streblomastix strix]|uniref:Uncharacterized protein n=1 Tax=Streblomastix strix TaxID=222440 RepID=A0A5J4U7J2_9EUKA|nr:MAG: hypothetical protein EZS28_038238 [Streblomastix strix]
MTVRPQNRNNQLDDNSNDEDGNEQQPSFRARVTFPFVLSFYIVIAPSWQRESYRKNDRYIESNWSSYS